MRTRRTPVSCGANQLFRLSPLTRVELERLLVPTYSNWGNRPKTAVRNDYERVREDEYDDKIYAGETVIFSDNDSYGNGRKLATLIRVHKLGEVVSLSGANPNTRSKITTYLWRYNGGKLKPARTAPKKKTVKERIVLE